MAARSQLSDPAGGKLYEEPLSLPRTPSVGQGTSIAVQPPSSVAASSSGIVSSHPHWIQSDSTAIESCVSDDASEISSSRRSSTSQPETLPPLTRGPSVASNDSRTSSISGPPLSAVTGLASFYSTHPLLEESESNPDVLLLPARLRPPSDYVCTFHFLNCMETFEAPGVDVYKCHVMSHFRGHPPPPTAKCPLCDACFYNPSFEEKDRSGGPSRVAAEADGTAWDEMLTHLAGAHFGQGERLKTARPDFDLYTWMWRRRLISDARYKSLQMEPVIRFGRNNERRDGHAVIRDGRVIVPPSAPSPPRQSVGTRDEPVTTTMSITRERRARGRGRP